MVELNSRQEGLSIFLLIFSKLHINLNITFAMRSFESLLVTIMNTACWSDQRTVPDLLPASQ